MTKLPIFSSATKLYLVYEIGDRKVMEQTFLIRIDFLKSEDEIASLTPA